ncbi:hypothetical protein HER32_05055 [Hymenobacter sp. BT18]|uniref:hypothetical protein n=1 Tax=Hymenobacter TaxID=89966 RepID=UPI00143ED52F|nr:MULTISPECIES: hypothetical protein [Hymenobacter]QIX60587.1 hypothetical protein HER32_05055 [Hymenobacter sp. BT18]
MKKLLILASVALVGLGACNRTKCPAYTSTKEANRVSSTISASTATSTERQ